MINSIKKFWVWMRRPNKSTFAQYVETIVIIVPLAFIIRTFFYGLYQVPTGSMETTMLVGERFFADKFTVLFRDLKHGDIIALNDPTYNYSENYFINLFQRYVYGPINWTKRVIGLPGDHIKGTVEDGKPALYRNGEKLDEPYLNKYPLKALYQDGKLDFRSYDAAYSFENQPFYLMNPLAVQIAQQILGQYDEESLLLPNTPTFSKGRNVDEFDIHLGPNQIWAMGDNRKGSADSRMFGPFDKNLVHGKIIFRLYSLDSYDSWFILDLLKHPIDFWKRIRWNRSLQFVY